MYALCPHTPLRPERTAEILRALTVEDKTFACHQTTHLGEWDNDEEGYRPSGAEQHCAGALILIEKAGIANAMVQIAERLGLYQPLRLDMTAPVFATPQAMQEHMTALH
jgi:hypothetical protein